MKEQREPQSQQPKSVQAEARRLAVIAALQKNIETIGALGPSLWGDPQKSVRLAAALAKDAAPPGCARGVLDGLRTLNAVSAAHAAIVVASYGLDEPYRRSAKRLNLHHSTIGFHGRQGMARLMHILTGDGPEPELKPINRAREPVMSDESAGPPRWVQPTMVLDSDGKGVPARGTVMVDVPIHGGKARASLVVEVDPDGRTAQHYRTQDSITVLRRNGAIAAEHESAARRFQRAFDAAGYNPLRAIQLGGNKLGAAHAQLIRSRQEDARAEVGEVMERAGGTATLTGSAIWNVIGGGLSIREWMAGASPWGTSTSTRRPPGDRRGAAALVVAALEILALFYQALDDHRQNASMLSQIEARRKLKIERGRA